MWLFEAFIQGEPVSRFVQLVNWPLTQIFDALLWPFPTGTRHGLL